MSWRTIVVSHNAKLDYQLGYLVIRKEETIKVHISEIAILIIETTAVSLTSYLLCELIKKKVKIIFCDEKRNPSFELIPYYGSHDSSVKVRNQISWSDDVKALIWTEIVTEKIRRQRDLLKETGKHEHVLLDRYIDEMEFRDQSNREGHAAKVYFNALFGLSFTRSSESSINAALNYGYSIILSIFNREITAKGYLTQLGLFHDNMFNPYNFSSDLMEPYRILVDERVFHMMPKVFDKSEKFEVLQILEKEVLIEGRKEFLPNAIKIYVSSIFDALNENDPSKIQFYRNELSIYENNRYV